MKKKNILVFLCLLVCACFAFAQQVNTDNSFTPQQLIQNLISNDCATVNNVSSSVNGNVNNIISYGSFNSGTSNFPLEGGIVLSTGRVTSAGNTLTGENLNEGEINWTTDNDIENILGIDQTLNATSIEFDFASANNFVSFKYLFASDEYQQDYPCNFKDVFAILLKRAGTADPYVNIAVVPETTTAITTNTIHPDINGFCEAENENYFQGYNIGSTNFNGHTKVLTATSAIIPNETYHIKFVIADHIDERFDSAVFIDAEGFGSSIDLGPDQSVCGNDIILDADIANTSAIYTWFLNSTSIAGENNPTLEVNQSGTYTVEISIPSPSGNCTLTDSIEIEIVPFQPAAPIEDLLICDPAPSDGVYDLDFPFLKNDEIFDSLPSTNYNVSYHLNEDDAQNNSNSIIGLYQNTEETETIFVRIESLSGDCLQLGSFNISIAASPNTFEIEPISVCDGFINDGGLPLTEFDGFDFALANYEFNRTVSYHLNENDAINNENPITRTTELIGEPLFIFARVVDNFNGCFSTVRVNFDYQNSPDLAIDKYIVDACFDPNYYETNGPATFTYQNTPVPFNIDDAISEIEQFFPGADVRLLTFLGLGETPRILSPTQTITPLSIGISYDGTYCEAEITLELHKNLLYNILEDEITIDQCDDDSNDGVFDFNLIEIVEELKSGYDINIALYISEEDLENQVNQIDQSVPFTIVNSGQLYVASTYNDCSLSSIVNFNILESPVIEPQVIDVCGNYNPDNNTTTIFLEQFDALMAQDIINDGVDYYLTEEDALNEENPLGETYAIAGNTQRFYVRITEFFPRCPDIATLDVNVLNSIELNQPSPLIACDENLDGIEIVNLESIIPELLVNPENYTITFHTSSIDALLGNSLIDNASSYSTTTTEIFVRVTLPGTDCITITNFDVLIFNNPQLNTISEFISCESNPNMPSGFFFIDKDIEIINGQAEMQVRYFETEEDAINGVDEINKTIAYQNSSNPQTIYVRLENETQNSCYKIAPMQIEVRQAPIYNQPTDVFECDVNSTGLATTDLNEKIVEISVGSTTNLNISFHLTPLNASVGSNAIPLNYIATSNPQLIYARVENIDSGCVDTPTFFINTLSLPEVNFDQSLVECGNNYNFSPEWNLTDIELEVIEGRQYGIDYTYYESEADLMADANAIPNPENYTNTSNPQTIYLRVRNTITGCFSSVPFELLLNSPPIINEFEIYNLCDNDTNSLNLLDINNLLLDNTFNVLVSYYATLNDAETNQNPLNNYYNYNNTTETLYVRAEYSTTNCYVVYPFTLNVNPLPIANQPNDLIACDDNFDGLLEFDLSLQNNTILNGQNSNDFSVSYHNTELNANENVDALNSDYTAFNGEIIFARLENNNTGCYDITQFSVVVNPLPIIDIEDQVICLNNLPLLVSAETNNPSDNYLWSTNATSPEIEIFETGTYSVTITNQFGCENTDTFNVTESESAEIDVVETIDFSDPNNITVTVTGIGNYLYQLNDLPFQTSNVFENVPIGYNTITIIDQNGCARVTREVLVIDVPKHFTPNGDGDFDTWHITGAETLPGTIIHIFDRYGKLLKELGHNSDGWNGTFNGNKMPAGDYWYIANVFRNNERFQIKGHFSLRR